MRHVCKLWFYINFVFSLGECKYIPGSGLNNLHSFLVYVEQGRSTTSTTLTFTTASTSGITWKAKVTQIECYRWVSSLFPFIFNLCFKVGNSPLALFATEMEAQMFSWMFRWYPMSYHYAVTQKRWVQKMPYFFS